MNLFLSVVLIRLKHSRQLVNEQLLIDEDNDELDRLISYFTRVITGLYRGNRSGPENSETAFDNILAKEVQTKINGNETKRETKSIFLWSKVKIKVRKIVHNKLFEPFILILIVMSTLILILDSPLEDQKTRKLYATINDIFSFAFAIELCLRVVACQGFRVYCRDGWNKLDLVCVLSSIPSLLGVSSEAALGKGFRCLRVRD